MGPVYHLPLTLKSVEAFLRDGQAIVHPIEAAAMLVALSHLRVRLPHAAIDRFVREAFPLFRTQPGEGLRQLEVRRVEAGGLDANAFVAGLLDSAVVLVDQSAIDSRRWLGADGHYTAAFQESCSAASGEIAVSFHALGEAEDPDGEAGERAARSRPLHLNGTRDQAVVASVVASAPGERISIDAYAGTGKTFLVHALRDHLPSGFTLVTPRAQQGHAINQHAAAGQGVKFKTLSGLAYELAAQHVRAAGRGYAPGIGRSERTVEDQAQIAGIPRIGSVPVHTVMWRLYQALRAFSNSGDRQISERHFARAGIRDRSELPRYVEAAKLLWKAMFSTSVKNGQVFEIWADQIAKWLDINSAEIPAQRGTLLIDEAHDLSPAWGRLFDRYQGGCILLGDPHQRLRGASYRPEHSQTARMTMSLRTGIQAADEIEHTLSLTTLRTMSGFESARDHVTRLHRYDASSPLPETGLRLFGSEWSLLEAALRRVALDAPFHILPASRRLMEESVRSARALFDGRALPLSARVSGQSSWDELARHLELKGQSAILRLFERGFDEGNLSRLLKYEEACVAAPITLGLIDHSKNLEFPIVSLALCCYEDASARRGFEPINASYLGMTRAQHELWVPGDSLDRLVDMKRAGAG